MNLTSDIDNITLDVLSTRLKNIVTPLNILRWLSNFKKSEIPIAIDIISTLTVYTTNEIEEILNSEFESLFGGLIKKEKITVVPVGELGKSGNMIVYFFQKTEFYKKNKNRITLMSGVVGDTSSIKYSQLVLLDDFVGTGGTIISYHNKHIDPIRDHFSKIYFIGIAGMESGINKIRAFFDEVKIPMSNKFKKAFSSDASYFGYRKHGKYRNLAYKYGKEIVRPLKSKTGKPNALGYENSQALVSFAYGTPNNTLPIIWANTNGWFPLIPRFYVDKVSASKILRKNILHELAILKEFGSAELQDTFFSFRVKKGKKTFSSVDKIDFSLYAIIKLSRKGFTPVNICQKLGVFYNDYEELIKKGVERGLFDENERLTEFGLQLYFDAKKCIGKNKKLLREELNSHKEMKSIDYLPKTFNGRS